MKKFYDFELEGRKKFAYPPFTKLIQVVVKHRDKQQADAAIRFICDSLQPSYGNYLVGPAAPSVERVRNQYLMELLLKLPREARVIKQVKQALLDIEVKMKQLQGLKNAVVVLDVDPL